MKTRKLRKGERVVVIREKSTNHYHQFKRGEVVNFTGRYATFTNNPEFVNSGGIHQFLNSTEYQRLKPITPAHKRANTNQKSNKMTQTETGKFQTRITDEKTLTRYQKFMKRNKIATRSQLVAEALREYVRNNS